MEFMYNDTFRENSSKKPFDREVKITFFYILISDFQSCLFAGIDYQKIIGFLIIRNCQIFFLIFIKQLLN
jgi:hypothetical protein